MNTYIKTLRDSDGDIVYPHSSAQAILRLSGTGNVEASLYSLENSLALLASCSYVDLAIANLIGSSHDNLLTLAALGAALGDDENFSTTVINYLSLKVDSSAIGTAAYADVESTGIASNTNTIPTTALVKTYVDNNAGGVGTILIDGVVLPVTNGLVTLDLSNYVGISNIASSNDNKTLYLLGLDTNAGAVNYNANTYFNPSTGYLTANKVFNAIWNDYAEWFEKDNINEIFEPGDICIWTGKGITKSNKENDKTIIGVVSDSYGHILGGELLDNMDDNNEKFAAIGLCGRVKTKIIGKVEIGDLIVSSNVPGHGIVNNDAPQNQVIGKALESSDIEESKLITLLI